MVPNIFASVLTVKKQSQRAQRIAAIPEEDIKEYIEAVNFDDVVADDLIQTVFDIQRNYPKMKLEFCPNCSSLNATGFGNAATESMRWTCDDCRATWTVEPPALDENAPTLLSELQRKQNPRRRVFG
jgi:hypothetical protein